MRQTKQEKSISLLDRIDVNITDKENINLIYIAELLKELRVTIETSTHFGDASDLNQLRKSIGFLTDEIQSLSDDCADIKYDLDEYIKDGLVNAN